MSENQKLTFIEHFGILRKSFIKIILLIIVFFIPAFYFRDLLMELSLYPIIQNLPMDSKIIFTKPTEGLSTNIKLAFLSSFIITTPIIIYEIWSFIKPALYEKEIKFTASIFTYCVVLVEYCNLQFTAFFIFKYELFFHKCFF